VSDVVGGGKIEQLSPPGQGSGVLARLAELNEDFLRALPPNFFADIRSFHEKFGLAPTDGRFGAHVLDQHAQRFRIKFMFEELLEYCRAVGYSPTIAEDGTVEVKLAEAHDGFDGAQAFDGLIDLVYVALGTAYLHGFPFDEGWKRVQAANMAKVRATSEEQSKRGSKLDVVKPPGWKAPSLEDLL
jgi:predicted HAD superfamily Cof-like phosphohydrolase